MCAKKKKILVPSKQNLTRKHRTSLVFNDKEYELIQNYLTRHRIKNKSKFFREVIVRHVWEQIEENTQLFH
jgi:hypothetical protein